MKPLRSSPPTALALAITSGRWKLRDTGTSLCHSGASNTSVSPGVPSGTTHAPGASHTMAEADWRPTTMGRKQPSLPRWGAAASQWWWILRRETSLSLRWTPSWRGCMNSRLNWLSRCAWVLGSIGWIHPASPPLSELGEHLFRSFHKIQLMFWLTNVASWKTNKQTKTWNEHFYRFILTLRQWSTNCLQNCRLL